MSTTARDSEGWEHGHGGGAGDASRSPAGEQGRHVLSLLSAYCISCFVSNVGLNVVAECSGPKVVSGTQPPTKKKRSYLTVSPG